MKNNIKRVLVADDHSLFRRGIVGLLEAAEYKVVDQVSDGVMAVESARKLRPDLVHIDEEPYNLATAHATWLARRAGARTLFFSWQNLNRRYPPPFCWTERYVLGRSEHAIVGNRASAQVFAASPFPGQQWAVSQTCSLKW